MEPHCRTFWSFQANLSFEDQPHTVQDGRGREPELLLDYCLGVGRVNYHGLETEFEQATGHRDGCIHNGDH